MKKLSASSEMYLKTIYQLSESRADVRAADIASQLKVARPSVTEALKLLAAKKLVKYAPYDVVALTREGSKIARDVLKRFDILNQFFNQILSMSEKESATVACAMEHVVTGAAMERLVCFIEYIRDCPGGKVAWNSSRGGFFCNSADECDCAHSRK